MKNKNFLSSVVGSLLILAAVNAGANHGVYPTHFPWDSNRFASVIGSNIAPPGGAKLLYYGGPVISHVKAYAVFWGDSVNHDTTQKIGAYFDSVSNSTYLDFLEQYATFGKAVDGRAGTGQHIGRGKYMGAITIHPAFSGAVIDDVQIQSELDSQIKAGVLPQPDADTLFMTYFPPGLTITVAGLQSCKELCAYHGMTGTPTTPHFYYGVMPDIGGSCSLGCGVAHTDFDSLTAISAHEFVEAITDPFPTPGSNPGYPQAWNDVQGAEIGDLCAMGGGNNVLTSTSANLTFAVQSEWDNAAGQCTSQSWTSP
jgi:hypothetical protein